MPLNFWSILPQTRRGFYSAVFRLVVAYCSVFNGRPKPFRLARCPAVAATKTVNSRISLRIHHQEKEQFRP